MDWAALLSVVIPLLEKWVPVALASPQGQAFVVDIVKVVAAAHAASAGTGTAPNFGAIFQQFLAALQTGTPPAAAAGTALAKSNPAMMPTSGPGGTFTS